MKPLDFDYRIARLTEVIRSMAEGKPLVTPEGIYGIDKNMTIGLVMFKPSGERFISWYQTLDLHQLDALLTRHNIRTPFALLEGECDSCGRQSYLHPTDWDAGAGTFGAYLCNNCEEKQCEPNI